MLHVNPGAQKEETRFSEILGKNPNAPWRLAISHPKVLGSTPATEYSAFLRVSPSQHRLKNKSLHNNPFVSEKMSREKDKDIHSEYVQ